MNPFWYAVASGALRAPALRCGHCADGLAWVKGHAELCPAHCWAGAGLGTLLGRLQGVAA